jgi:hypothetical protein
LNLYKNAFSFYNEYKTKEFLVIVKILDIHIRDKVPIKNLLPLLKKEEFGDASSKFEKHFSKYI